MKKKRMVELIKELMRLNNETTAVLIQLSVYLKEDKSETRIERLKRKAIENPEGTKALLDLIENADFVIVSDICENCNLSPNEKTQQIIRFWETCEAEITLRKVQEWIDFMNTKPSDPGGEHRIPPSLADWLTKEINCETKANTNKKNVIEQENVTIKRDKVELERRKMNDKPNPGSKEAIGQGCICPMLDNYHGKGVPYSERTAFWYHPDCPVHKEEEDVEG